MRKNIVGSSGPATASADWLDLEAIATAELTSENPSHPIEQALVRDGRGWRAAGPGEQRIRLTFDAPRAIERVQLVFVESERSRTQEVALLWSADGRDFRELVRQQWTFHPPTGTREQEDYAVHLDGVRALELRIRPDVSGGDAVATLAALRVGGRSAR